MAVTSIREAKSNLSKFVEQVENGKEIIIGRAGKPVAKLVPYGRVPKGPCKGGQLKGRIRVSDDFDTLPEDIAAALGMSEEK